MSQYLFNRLASCRLFPISSVHPARSFVNRELQRPVPPRIPETVGSAQQFLKIIGRDAASKLKVEKWKELWTMDGHAMKKAGLGVRDRRYILWCMEKFRQGETPKEFAHEMKPKKKVRGHGPAVQNGKRIRSRRKR